MLVTTKPGEKLSVLIVDDEVEVRETIREFIDLMGCFKNIVEATNGAEAYSKINKQTFDLIITDLLMPKIDGTQLIEKVMEDAESEKLIVKPNFILLSANLTSQEVQRAIMNGVRYVIAKPCYFENFAQKVVENLKNELANKIVISD